MIRDMPQYIFLCIEGLLAEGTGALTDARLNCDLVGFITALQMVYNLFFFIKLDLAERTGIIFVVR